MKRTNALKTLLTAVGLDVAGGIAFALIQHVSVGIGLYWALTTATTVGYGDVTPQGTAAHIIAVLIMLTVVPLFAATYALITTGLTATHVRREGAKQRKRLDHIIEHHPDIPSFREEQ